MQRQEPPRGKKSAPPTATPSAPPTAPPTAPPVTTRPSFPQQPIAVKSQMGERPMVYEQRGRWIKGVNYISGPVSYDRFYFADPRKILDFIRIVNPAMVNHAEQNLQMYLKIIYLLGIDPQSMEDLPAHEKEIAMILQPIIQTVPSPTIIMFHFFGDRHNGHDLTCNQVIPSLQCSEITFSMRPGIEYQECSDINYWLKAKFDYNTNLRLYTDFYLETPLKSRPNVRDYLDNLAEALRDVAQYQELTYLTPEQENKREHAYGEYENLDFHKKIEVVFNECFQKEIKNTPICPYYPYIRFHRADILMTETPTQIVTTFANLIYNRYVAPLFNYWMTPNIYEQNVIERIVHLTNVLHTLIMSPIDTILKLYQAHARSDNFFMSVQPLLLGFPSEDRQYFIETLNVNTVMYHGHHMHRMRKEIQTLYDDNILFNGENISVIIQRYADDRYNNMDLKRLLQGNWMTYYNSIYEPYTRYAPLPSNTLEIITDVHNQIKTLLLGIDDLMLDSYMLARMFHRSHKKPREIPAEVITYMEYKHTDAFAIFFTRYLHLSPIGHVPPRAYGNIPGVTERCIH